MAQQFKKPPLHYMDQVLLLTQRGMVIGDALEASGQLATRNYYRLAAYWLPFEDDHLTHSFKANTTFDQVLELYEFDRSLRLLVLDAIERIEVAVRARWAYELAHAHGPHAHLDVSLAKQRKRYWHNRAALERETKKSKERFIVHLRTTYSEPLPPTWAACEVMTLGMLSHWYANLGPIAVRAQISDSFGLDHLQLESSLHHLVTIRNTCAHHSRLWNREFTITPARPKSKPMGMARKWHNDSRRLYNTLLIIAHFLDEIAPGHGWRSDVSNHLATLPSALTLADMGFPDGASV